MNLNADQRGDIRNFLVGRGLAFEPLLNEMSDHIECDIENLMAQGLTFEEALARVVAGLPEDHFKLIQTETMETISHRFTISRALTYLALAAMLVATAFKLMHLSGADLALVVSLIALCASLIFGSVSGMYYNRDKKGSVRVMGVVAGVVVMILGYGFKVLQWPGADGIIITATVVVISSMTANTLYVYSHSSGKGNLFTYLHEKYSPGIERFLVILTGFVVLFGIVKVLGNYGRGFDTVISVAAIYGAGLQLISLSWRRMENDLAQRNSLNLYLILLVLTSFSLPMLGPVAGFETRLLSIILFNIGATLLAYRMDAKQTVSSAIAFIVALAFSYGSLSKLLGSTLNLGSLPAIAILGLVILTGIFLSKKESLTRMYLILSLAAFFIESGS